MPIPPTAAHVSRNFFRGNLIYGVEALSPLSTSSLISLTSEKERLALFRRLVKMELQEGAFAQSNDLLLGKEGDLRYVGQIITSFYL